MGILLFLSFMYVSSSVPFPSGSYAYSQLVPVTPSDQIGPAMSEFLWQYRGLDLLFQTLVLFATSICCLAMLRRELR